ncbi:MAG: D-glycerate dehydrogenase [Hydrogenibacillus schlegelii]|uniref:D-glycerate dehydrogenase n=1 Tax=Hydrogenibacillus schlegelii TaxID=1484 RepID=A0A947CYB6_HYDSH|nr:D-glycerate dehydrogenase [Hydrogenibacillus schlegelii]
MSDRRIFVSRRLPEAVLAPLRSLGTVEVWPEETVPPPREVLLEAAARARAMLTLITDRIDAEMIERAESLAIIANMAVGYNNIDVAAARRRGIWVTNTPDVLTETTADLVMALLLAAMRRLPQAERALRERKWQGWSPFDFVGLDVHGKRLGIFGMGRIGRAVARRARGFDMEILYHNRRRLPEAVERGIPARYVDFAALVQESDVLVILAPYAPELYHRFNREVLYGMKHGAVLIVASRGGIVDEAALVEVLRAGHLAAAGLDVFETEPIPPDHPLLTVENAVLLPHIGSATVETRLKMAERAVDNIVRVLTGRPPRDPVDADGP